MKINGKKLSNIIIDNIQKKYNINKNILNKPKLGIILVGDRPDSNLFIKKKIELCEKLGFDSEIKKLSKNCKLENLLNSLESFNKEPLINGIVLQLPLPIQFQHNLPLILKHIDRSKDVDCLNPYNYSNMFLDKKYLDNKLMFPCISLAVNNILKHLDINLKGKKTIIIGRSYLVGFPLNILFQQKGCIITLCNEKTINLKSLLKDADIIVSATGVKHLVKINDVKNNAILIDVGVCLKNGKYYGDIENVKKRHNFNGYYTPVPGGVGPLTVAILMENLFKNWAIKNEISY